LLSVWCVVVVVGGGFLLGLERFESLLLLEGVGALPDDGQKTRHTLANLSTIIFLSASRTTGARGKGGKREREFKRERGDHLGETGGDEELSGLFVAEVFPLGHEQVLLLEEDEPQLVEVLEALFAQLLGLPGASLTTRAHISHSIVLLIQGGRQREEDNEKRDVCRPVRMGLS